MAHGHQCGDLIDKSLSIDIGDAETTEDPFDSDQHSFIPSELKEKIRTLMNDYPEGIDADQLRVKFREKFGEELDVKALKFCDVAEFCFHLEDVVIVRKRLGKGVYFIHPVRTANNEINDVPEISPLGNDHKIIIL